MTTDKLVYNADEAAQVLDISRPLLYQLINKEDFPSFRVGGRVLISVEGLRQWVLRQAGGETA